MLSILTDFQNKKPLTNIGLGRMQHHALGLRLFMATLG